MVSSLSSSVISMSSSILQGHIDIMSILNMDQLSEVFSLACVIAVFALKPFDYISTIV
jgi:hypothetical protein